MPYVYRFTKDPLFDCITEVFH